MTKTTFDQFLSVVKDHIYLNRVFRRRYRYSYRLKGPLYLSAVMPRSGSTLLFNILREILMQKWGDELASGWVRDFGLMPRGRAYLIKSHTISETRLWKPKHTFYTYRDVRVAAVSSFRKSSTEITKNAIKQKIDVYIKAKSQADLMIKYEDLINELPNTIEKIAEALQLDVDIRRTQEVVMQIENPKIIDLGIGDERRRYSRHTLLHVNHRTGTKDNDWRDVIPNDLKEWINSEYAWWFTECNYPPD